MTPPDLKPGDKLVGRYTIQRVLGKGGFGTVFLAVQDAIQRQVAIKALKPELAAEHSRLREAFRDEAIHTSRLRHPNTITIIGFEETPDGGLYLIMEYLKGVSLGTVIDRNGAMSLRVVLSLGIQIAKSLAEAHDIGLIHGDLKPDNVMVCEHYGDPHFVKVLDFGIARVMGVPTDVVVGTPGYMAPEQCTGEAIGPQADVFALGRVLFEMLTGFNAEASRVTLRLTDKDIPDTPARSLEDISKIIERATEFDPVDRFANAAELLNHLTNLNNNLSGSGSGLWRLPSFNEEPEDLGDDIGDSMVFGEVVEGGVSAEGETPWSMLAEPLPSLDLSAEARVDPILRGRKFDQWLMESAVEEMVASRRGVVMSIVGPAGSGRSALARWLLDIASQRPDLSVGLGDYEGGAFSGPVGLADALAQALGCSKTKGHHNFGQISAALEERSGAKLRPNERAVLLGLIGWSNMSSPKGTEGIIARLIALAACARPMLLVLDGADAADALTLGVIEALAALIDERPIPLMLVCAVTEGGAVAARMARLAELRTCVSRTDLTPLNTTDQRAVIESLFTRLMSKAAPNATPSPPLVDFIAECSGGLPALMAAHVSHLGGAKVLRPSPQGLVLSPRAPSAALFPPSIEERLLADLLARLGAPSQRRDDLIFILLRLSVLGEAIPSSLLRDQLLAEQRRGHLCAERALEQLSSQVRELIGLGLIERILAPGDNKRLLRFCSDATRWAVERVADDLSDARAVHQLAARAKAEFHQKNARVEIRGRSIVEHLAHSTQLAEGAPRPHWPAHRDCWRR